ncbi:MAG: phosphatase PAP2 family protein [Bacteroidales bacterium]|jgi:undecaprenyl-diphosphatase|nr:phosphatase PAP2 family protein [Bacteroidales bacterium]
MIESLIDFDKTLFSAVNSFRSDWADWFFAILSSHLFIAIVVSAVAIYLMLTQYRKRWWHILILIALSFLLADRISVLCFKDVFMRLRPSHLMPDVFVCKLSNFHLIYDNKGGLYGFVSSHAANVFSLAALFALLSRKRILTISVFVWAILTGYSRIYCGYHYPADVVCGGLLGVIIGLILFLTYSYLIKRFSNSIPR